MTHNQEPGDYTPEPDGVSPHYLRVFPDGSEEQMQCEPGLAAWQIRPGEVICAPPRGVLRPMRPIALTEVRRDGPDGDSADAREPRHPVPPSPHLRGAQNIPPDSDPISLPGTDG
ncbi:hypothetical protein ABZ942_32455 [Nocardia sp. NPDC046473]|uniref:hypothetical protein n=1 Tax=Nocardia sp. NPDC046473 TaxID=3155733 RepID=UPI0033E855C2